MDFGGTIITTQGRDLITKLIASGGPLNFSQAAVSDGKSTSPITDTDLTGNKTIVPMIGLDAQSGIALLTIEIGNQGLAADANYYQMGIWADDPTLGPVLFAINQADQEPLHMTAEGGTEVDVYHVQLAIIVSSLTNITANLNPVNWATYDQMVEYIELYAAKKEHEHQTGDIINWQNVWARREHTHLKKDITDLKLYSYQGIVRSYGPIWEIEVPDITPATNIFEVQLHVTQNSPDNLQVKINSDAPVPLYLFAGQQVMQDDLTASASAPLVFSFIYDVRYTDKLAMISGGINTKQADNLYIGRYTATQTTPTHFSIDTDDKPIHDGTMVAVDFGNKPLNAQGSTMPVLFVDGTPYNIEPLGNTAMLFGNGTGFDAIANVTSIESANVKINGVVQGDKAYTVVTQYGPFVFQESRVYTYGTDDLEVELVRTPTSRAISANYIGQIGDNEFLIASGWVGDDGGSPVRYVRVTDPLLRRQGYAVRAFYLTSDGV